MVAVTAFEYREYTLVCDHRDGDGSRCTVHYGPFGVERSLRVKFSTRRSGRPVALRICFCAALRKLAARDGWTHVRSPAGRKYDDDFCPKHSPARWSVQTQRGRDDPGDPAPRTRWRRLAAAGSVSR